MRSFRTQTYVLYEGLPCRIKAVNLSPGGPLLTLATKSGDVTVGAGEVTKADDPSGAELLADVKKLVLQAQAMLAKAERGVSPVQEFQQLNWTYKNLVISPQFLREGGKAYIDALDATWDGREHKTHQEWARNVRAVAYRLLNFVRGYTGKKSAKSPLAGTPAEQGWMIAKWGNKYLPRIEGADLAQIKRNPREYIDLVNKIRDLSRYAGDATQKRQLIAASQLFAQAIRETLYPKENSNPVRDVPYFIQRAANTLRAGIAEVSE